MHKVLYFTRSRRRRTPRSAPGHTSRGGTGTVEPLNAYYELRLVRLVSVRGCGVAQGKLNDVRKVLLIFKNPCFNGLRSCCGDCGNDESC
jgi:hypothetical protein